MAYEKNDKTQTTIYGKISTHYFSQINDQLKRDEGGSDPFLHLFIYRYHTDGNPSAIKISSLGTVNIFSGESN